MVPHAAQARYANCTSRYCVVPAGRRTGKTEIAKRRLVRRALLCHLPDSPFFRPYPDPRFCIAAPTVQQVKNIYWSDVLALIPPHLLYGRPNASTLTIKLINGALIQLLGMDRPERAEGRPWDMLILDEFGNMKASAWHAHMRPALADRGGSCDFIGCPEGLNHYYQLAKQAEAEEIEAKKEGREPVWTLHHWTSLEILPLYRGEEGLKEIEMARSELDELVFKQEMQGDFVSYSGRAYYNFGTENKRALTYEPDRPLVLTLDFNVEPSVGVVLQEQEIDGRQVTAVLSEIYIPRGGNVLKVCDKFHHDYKSHTHYVFLHGDATGGARGAAKIHGSEWELARRRLRSLLNPGQLINKMPRRNPLERDRVNALNCRCKNLNGEARLYVDPTRAPYLVEDLESMCVIQGGCGELDKSNPQLSHLCLRGDTIVETQAAGRVPIADVQESGLVRNPFGMWAPYERAGLTIPNAEMVEVVTCDSRLYCTPWHRWFTTEGWCSAKSLEGKTLVHASSLMTFRNFMENNIDALVDTLVEEAPHADCIAGEKYRTALEPVAQSCTGASVQSVRPVSNADAYCLWVPREGCFQAGTLSQCFVSANSDALGYYINRIFPIKKVYVRTKGRRR